MAQFTTVFRATGDAQRRRPKRNRQAVSCTGCQKRKSRCDRRQPCSGCERRGEACRFGPSPSQSAAAAATGDNALATASTSGSRRSRDTLPGPRGEVQSRLDRLEDMVRAFAEGRKRQAGQVSEKRHDEASASGAEDAGKGRRKGKGEKDGDEGREGEEEEYHEAASWTTLVENIQDIKSALRNEDAKYAHVNGGVVNPSSDQNGAAPPLPPAPSRAHEPSILTADHLPATVEDVLAALPARPESDRLISIFFNARFMALPVIHAHQFRRQYDAFWRDPAAADMLWVSILFSLLAAAATISVVRSLPVTTVSAKSLLDMSGRCLAAGQYLLGARPHAVESLLLHTYVRSMQRDDGDADPSVWAMQGLAIRLAQRRGYHRDSAKVNPSLSFFEAEMRRRVWFLCSAFDCLWSFHQGTPPAVVDDVCDAGHPSCLTDDDFDEDTPSSPPPVERPHTDPLPILASHYKSRLCPIMRRIIWNALSVRHRPSSGPGSALAAAMELSEELQAWHRSVPACLRFRPIRSTAFADAPHAIMHRIMLENLYRKCLCILHRPYLGSFSFSSPAATTDEKDGNGGTEAADIRNRSRRICREAAVGIMDIHIQVDAETHPGGRLYEDRFMISNLTLHDLLIAAMIICVDLHKSTDIPYAPHPLLLLPSSLFSPHSLTYTFTWTNYHFFLSGTFF